MAIDYTNYNYEDLRDRITELYKDKEGIGQGYEGSTGQMLIDLLSDVTDHLFHTLEFRTQETYLETARLDTSIRARASELGYRPRRRVSSTGTVELTLIDEDGYPISAGGEVFIRKNTALTMDDFTFVTTADVSIQKGQSTATIPIKEGVLAQQQYDFDTEPYVSDPTIVIGSYQEIDEFSLRVSDRLGVFDDLASPTTSAVNITSLSYAMPDDSFYDIRYAREGMRILFGDGEFGRKPSGTVNLQWVASNGERVSVLRTGLDFRFAEDFLRDDQNVSPAVLYRYSMKNITPIRGGQSEESIREIARNAPEFARTANRAVTSQDHEFWVMRSGVGAIVDANVYGEQETGDLIFNMNNVQVAYVTEDELPLNVEQEQALRAFMDKYKMVTTHLAFNDVDKIQAVLDIDIKRDNINPMTDAHLYEVVVGYLEDYFKIKRGSIGKEVQHSEVVKFLQGSTYRFNNINYSIADWVNVKMCAQYPIDIPINTYDVLVYLDDSYVFTTGDVFTIELDGTAYSVTVEDLDTKDVLMERMRVEISNATNFLTALEEDDTVLRIKAPYLDSDFVIQVNQGDLAPYVTTDIMFHIPPSRMTNPQGDNLILPGSVTIIDQNENVLFEDDGEGMMQPVGSSNTAFGIDYVRCYLMSPTLDSGSYSIRYSQNEYQNIDSNFKSVITLSPFAEKINDPFLYSKLRII